METFEYLRSRAVNISEIRNFFNQEVFAKNLLYTLISLLIQLVLVT